MTPTSHKVQYILSSATVAPAALRSISHGFPGLVHVRASGVHMAPAGLRHRFLLLKGEDKMEALIRLMQQLSAASPLREDGVRDRILQSKSLLVSRRARRHSPLAVLRTTPVLNVMPKEDVIAALRRGGRAPVDAADADVELSGVEDEIELDETHDGTGSAEQSGLEDVRSSDLDESFDHLRDEETAVAAEEAEDASAEEELSGSDSNELPLAKHAGTGEVAQPVAPTIVFCNTVPSARAVEHTLAASGFATACYHADMPPRVSAEHCALRVHASA
jgi:superfamily II DNA/RNA helicase